MAKLESVILRAAAAAAESALECLKAFALSLFVNGESAEQGRSGAFAVAEFVGGVEFTAGIAVLGSDEVEAGESEQEGSPEMHGCGRGKACCFALCFVVEKVEKERFFEDD